jgi:hypothetical protein
VRTEIDSRDQAQLFLQHLSDELSVSKLGKRFLPNCRNQAIALFENWLGTVDV